MSGEDWSSAAKLERDAGRRPSTFARSVVALGVAGVLLLVLAPLGAFLVLRSVSPREPFDSEPDARILATRSRLEALAEEVELWSLEHELELPASFAELGCEPVPLDPWGGPLSLQRKDARRVLLSSLGPRSERGGFARVYFHEQLSRFVVRPILLEPVLGPGGFETWIDGWRVGRDERRRARLEKLRARYGSRTLVVIRLPPGASLEHAAELSELSLSAGFERVQLLVREPSR